MNSLIYQYNFPLIYSEPTIGYGAQIFFNPLLKTCYRLRNQTYQNWAIFIHYLWFYDFIAKFILKTVPKTHIESLYKVYSIN